MPRCVRARSVSGVRRPRDDASGGILAAVTGTARLPEAHELERQAGAAGGVGGWGLAAGVLGGLGGAQKPRGKRKRKASHALLADLQATAQGMVANAYAPSSTKVVKTALRALAEFEEVYRSVRPHMFLQPRWHGDLEASVHNEETLLLFAAWLYDHGLAPSSIATYVSLCKTNLGLAFGWALTVKELEMRLPRLLKGLRRLVNRIRKRRLGWRARYERLLRACLGRPEGFEAVTQWALRCALRQGLLRGADILPDGQAAFDVERHATLGDIKFECEGGRRYLDWTVLPAKKSEQQGKDEHLYLPEGDGVTDAYTAVTEMLHLRQQLFGAEPASAPLFIFPSKNPYKVQHARALFKASGALIDIPTEDLGAQSGRIGGATDLFVADTSPAVLQVAGRWVRTSSGRSREPLARMAWHPSILTLGHRSTDNGNHAHAEHEHECGAYGPTRHVGMPTGYMMGG